MTEQEQASETQASKLRTDLGQLQKDLGKLRTDFGDLLTALVDVSKSGAGEARQQIDARIEDLRHGVGVARQQSEALVHGAAEKIRQRPVTCVLVALGVGLLIGKLLDRRRE